MTEGETPFDGTVEPWQSVLDDMAGLARTYREEEWDALELHSRDVVVVEDADRFGLDVFVPEGEFDRLEGWIEAGTSLDSYAVYRTENTECVFVLVCHTDEETNRAVCVPAYYERSAIDSVRERALSEGLFVTHVRRSGADRVITFTQNDPGLFFPTETDPLPSAETEATESTGIETTSDAEPTGRTGDRTNGAGDIDD